MKRRMRYYIRQGWTIVELGGNEKTVRSYHGMRAWCEQNFNKESWAASLYGQDAASRFAFRDSADAALFSLRWL